MIDYQDDCFETERGVPTVTVELEGECRMIGYNSFRNAAFTGSRITIEFFDWVLTIDGKYLDSLWLSLQLQDVRVVRINPDVAVGQCAVSSIDVKRQEAEQELPEQEE